MAAWMIMLGSVFVVITVFEMVAGLRSIETREAVQGFLDEPPGQGLGLSVETVLMLLKTAGMVAAGCATAAAVLGGYVLKRHRQARVALTVIAVPLFVTGLVAGGFMSALVAAASVMLWLTPAKEWFDGKPIPEAPRRDAPARRPADRQVDREADRQSYGDQQAPPYPHGPVPPAPGSDGGPDGGPKGGPDGGPVGEPQTGAQPEQGPRPAERPFGSPPPAHVTAEVARQAVTSDRRPDGVVVAAILTWVFAGLVLLSSISGVVLMAAQPEVFLDELRRTAPELGEQGVTDRMIKVTTFVTGAVMILWCLLAIVLAALMLGRRQWAARALIVVATVSAMVSVAAMLGSVLMVVPAVAAIATLAVLRRPAVAAWFATGPHHR
jgi:hypothetical protein